MSSKRLRVGARGAKIEMAEDLDHIETARGYGRGVRHLLHVAEARL
jgi:hypothetical protein